MIDSLPNIQLEEDSPHAESAPKEKQGVKSLQIFFNPVINTRADVVAKVNNLLQSKGKNFSTDLLIELSLIYDTDKKTWLIDEINIQPAIPDDR